MANSRLGKILSLTSISMIKNDYRVYSRENCSFSKFKQNVCKAGFVDVYLKSTPMVQTTVKTMAYEFLSATRFRTINSEQRVGASVFDRPLLM